MVTSNPNHILGFICRCLICDFEQVVAESYHFRMEQIRKFMIRKRLPHKLQDQVLVRIRVIQTILTELDTPETITKCLPD